MGPVWYIPKYNTKTFCDVWDELAKFKDDFEGSPFDGAISSDGEELLYYLLYGKYGNNPIANLDENQFKYKVFSIIFEYGPTWEKRLDIQKTLRNMSLQDILAGGSETITGTDTNTGSDSKSESGNKNDTGSQSTVSVSASTINRDIANSGYQTNELDGTDILNHASNPPTTPTASSTTPLSYIDAQDYKTVDNTTTRRDNLKTDDDTSSVTGSTVSFLSGATVSYSNSATLTTAATLTISRLHVRDKDTIKGYAELWDLLRTDITQEFLSKFAPCFKTFVGPDRGWRYITEVEDYDE